MQEYTDVYAAVADDCSLSSSQKLKCLHSLFRSEALRFFSRKVNDNAQGVQKKASGFSCTTVSGSIRVRGIFCGNHKGKASKFFAYGLCYFQSSWPRRESSIIKSKEFWPFLPVMNNVWPFNALACAELRASHRRKCEYQGA